MRSHKRAKLTVKDLYHEILRRHCQPLDPLPTGAFPQLRKLPGVRAVLFDVYGTLFISASGEVGSGGDEGKAEAFVDALAAAGITADVDGERGIQRLVDTIRAQHAEAREQGVDYPEVNIEEIWKTTLAGLAEHGRIPNEKIDFGQVALEYEVRSNPVWPMPGLLECLEDLERRKLTLGLVSNAQFFTLELFPALLGKTAEALGFDPGLCHLSYCHGRAKPGVFLYQLAERSLAERGIGTREALYVGNDMLNDILPASSGGYRTALFAGDARSLRRREKDPRVQDITPDLILTDLRELKQCL